MGPKRSRVKDTANSKDFWWTKVLKEAGGRELKVRFGGWPWGLPLEIRVRLPLLLQREGWGVINTPFVEEGWTTEGDMPKASALTARKRQSDMLLKERDRGQATVLRIMTYSSIATQGNVRGRRLWTNRNTNDWSWGLSQQKAKVCAAD